jgi:hypothetical protein
LALAVPGLLGSQLREPRGGQSTACAKRRRGAHAARASCRLAQLTRRFPKRNRR